MTQHDSAAIDQMIARYVDWREACAVVSQTYDAWSEGSRAASAMLCASYFWALEREELAAAAYAHALTRLAGHNRDDWAPGDIDGGVRIGSKGWRRDH